MGKGAGFGCNKEQRFVRSALATFVYSCTGTILSLFNANRVVPRPAKLYKFSIKEVIWM